jgi:hypothetical protein
LGWGADITNFNTNLREYGLQYFLKISLLENLGGRHGHSNPVIRALEGEDPLIRDKTVSHPGGRRHLTQQR